MNETSRYGGYEDVPELAEYYDSVPQYEGRPDLEFYLDLCRQSPGSVLELGCGTGRILIPAAEAGCRITGLDFSSHMLNRCRAKLSGLDARVRERVTLVQQNMADFRLEERYNLVTIPFRPLQHIVSVDEQIGCLTRVREHLVPGGLLAFDVFHVDPLKAASPITPDEIEDMSERELPGGRWMRRTFRFREKHLAEQCNKLEVIYYIRHRTGVTERIVQSFPFRYFYRFELEHLLARTGFRIAALYGDFDRSPFRDYSPEMIFLAKRVG